MIYLDHNATTPPAPGVVQAMLAATTDVWANASSQHPLGQQAKRTLAAARAEGVMNVVSDKLNCRASACMVVVSNSPPCSKTQSGLPVNVL